MFARKLLTRQSSRHNDKTSGTSPPLAGSEDTSNIPSNVRSALLQPTLIRHQKRRKSCVLVTSCVQGAFSRFCAAKCVGESLYYLSLHLALYYGSIAGNQRAYNMSFIISSSLVGSLPHTPNRRRGTANDWQD